MATDYCPAAENDLAAAKRAYDEYVRSLTGVDRTTAWDIEVGAKLRWGRINGTISDEQMEYHNQLADEEDRAQAYRNIQCSPLNFGPGEPRKDPVLRW